MKDFTKVLTSASMLLAIANTTFAHEASKHMKDTEKPKCEAMSKMDMSKMDANDPVMLAMMKKCESRSETHDDMGINPAGNGISDCTPEHAEMGHCTMTGDKPSTEGNTHENH